MICFFSKIYRTGVDEIAKKVLHVYVYVQERKPNCQYKFVMMSFFLYTYLRRLSDVVKNINNTSACDVTPLLLSVITFQHTGKAMSLRNVHIPPTLNCLIAMDTFT